MATRGKTRSATEGAGWSGLPHGAKVLVDTAPFIYVLEDHPTFARRFAGMFEAESRGELHIALSTVTLAEVLVGPLQTGNEALARRYERALTAFELVPLDAALAVQAARLRARYRLRLPDAVQLAAALEIGAQALVTHDRDYASVQGLPVLYGIADPV